jgi:hypothetical protein
MVISDLPVTAEIAQPAICDNWFAFAFDELMLLR